MNICKFGYAVLVALVTIIGQAQANLIVLNETDFQANIGSVVVEQELFLTNIAGAPSITFDSGVTSVAVGGNPTSFGDNSIIDDTAFGDGDGEFVSAVGPAGVSPNSITWTFDSDITGFFGSFESVTFVRMQFLDALDNVLRTVDFEDVFPPNPTQGLDGFLGYINTANPFNQIQFTALPGVNFEIFSVNSFQFTDGTPVPAVAVPTPTSPLLFLIAFISVLLVSRQSGGTPS
ncbi:hypothetical protein [Thalassotalea montiporae]